MQETTQPSTLSEHNNQTSAVLSNTDISELDDPDNTAPKPSLYSTPAHPNDGLPKKQKQLVRADVRY